MKISIMDPQHTIFEGVVFEAILPGNGEELCVMDDHEPIFAALGQGSIRLKPLGKKAKAIKPIFIQRGLARMKKNELVILVE